MKPADDRRTELACSGGSLNPPINRITRALLLLIVLVAAGGVEADPAADLALEGGAVYTLDPGRPWAQAVAISQGRIVYVGDTKGLAAHVGPETRRIDLHGRMLLPGFHDSHIHLLAGGTRNDRCQLRGLAWPDAVLAALRSCAARLAEGQWLYGTDLDESVFAGRGPTRQWLDAIAGERPALVRDESGRLFWVNSAVLGTAGIDPDTPEPPNGVIERDAITGEPTGVLRDAAVEPVWRLIPEPGPEQYRAALQRASAAANAVGITSIIDARVTPTMLDAYRRADAAGELSVRVLASQPIAPKDGRGRIDELISAASSLHGNRLSAGSAKIFVDGEFGQHTAALEASYQDRPGDRGTLRIEPAWLSETIRRLDAAGLQVHLHVMGDRAIRLALDAIEGAIQANGPRRRRHQLAHVALPGQENLARMAALGVVADFQMLWAQPDQEMRGAIGPLGEDRARELLPIRSAFESGVTVVGGSDWPSESIDPLAAIQVALTRRPLAGGGTAWIPEQRASLAEMLAAYTLNGARLAGREQLTGSIETGKAADLVVLERNLFEVDPMNLQQVRVLLTLLDGVPVYRDPAIAWP